MLIIRFMFNLRQMGPGGSAATTAELSSHITSPRFTMNPELLGNIGEELDYGAAAEAASGADWNASVEPQDLDHRHEIQDPGPSSQ